MNEYADKCLHKIEAQLKDAEDTLDKMFIGVFGMDSGEASFKQQFARVKFLADLKEHFKRRATEK